MKAFKMALLGIQIFLITVSANAGTRVNNGAGTWVCNSLSTGKPKWIRSQDLLEGEERSRGNDHSRNYVGLDSWSILNKKLAEVSRSLPQLQILLVSHSVDLKTAIHLVPENLEFIDDGANSWKPSNDKCPGGEIEFAQIANFLIDGKLVINSKLWNSALLSEFDKAAILFHELVYFALREARGDQNSWRSRLITSSVMLNQNGNLVSEFVDAMLGNDDIGKDRGSARIVPFPVHLFCRFSVIEILDGGRDWKLIEEFNTPEIAYNSRIDETVEGFRFQVWTSIADGHPEMISITEINSCVSSEVEDKQLFAAFLRLKEVGLKMEINGSKPRRAESLCWSE